LISDLKTATCVASAMRNISTNFELFMAFRSGVRRSYASDARTDGRDPICNAASYGWQHNE